MSHISLLEKGVPEASNLDLPIGTDENSSRKSLISLAKWRKTVDYQQEAIWKYLLYSSQTSAENVHFYLWGFSRTEQLVFQPIPSPCRSRESCSKLSHGGGVHLASRKLTFHPFLSGNRQCFDSPARVFQQSPESEQGSMSWGFSALQIPLAPSFSGT